MINFLILLLFGGKLASCGGSELVRNPVGEFADISEYYEMAEVTRIVIAA